MGLIDCVAITVEVIQFEVLRRLHFGHGLPLEDIDVTGVLPKLRHTNRDGLIYAMTQRCVGLCLYRCFHPLNAAALTQRRSILAWDDGRFSRGYGRFRATSVQLSRARTGRQRPPRAH